MLKNTLLKTLVYRYPLGMHSRNIRLSRLYNTANKPRPSQQEITAHIEIPKKQIDERGKPKQLSTHEQILSLIVGHKQCQLSTASIKGDVDSTLVPYAVVDKSTMRLFESEDDVPFGVFPFEHFEIVLCFRKSSPHVQNLKLKDQLVSITVGHTPTMTRRFEEAHRIPPKALVSGKVKRVEDHSLLKKSLWRDFFELHPHVNVKMEECALFRVLGITNGYYTDFHGKMHGVDDVRELSVTRPDPLSQVGIRMLEKYNKNTEELDRICRTGYNLDLEKKFIYAIDRFAIRLLGKSKDDNDFAEYILDYGHEILSEAKLKDFLLQFHAE